MYKSTRRTHRGVHGATIRGATVDRQLLTCLSCASFGDPKSLERFASCHRSIMAQRRWQVCCCRESEARVRKVPVWSVSQQLPSLELQRHKGGFLFVSLLGQNVPLCAVEHVVKRLGDVFVTALYLGRCAKISKIDVG